MKPHDTLNIWFEEHRLELFRFLWKLTGDEHRAEDLLQETFVRAALKFHLFNPQRGTPKNWLYRMAIHLARDAERFRQRDLQLHRDVAVRMRHAADELPAETTADIKMLARALQLLDVEKRSLILLALHHNQQEIADMLEIPGGTVKSRLHHARRSLTVLLTKLERGNG